MENTIYEVRKHGALKVESKAKALKIIEAAKNAGYTFGHKIEGWNHLVVDLDA